MLDSTMHCSNFDVNRVPVMMLRLYKINNFVSIIIMRYSIEKEKKSMHLFLLLNFVHFACEVRYSVCRYVYNRELISLYNICTCSVSVRLVPKGFF